MPHEAQIPMHIECLEDAILEAVNAIGGKKAVGVALKPDRSAVDGGKWLSDCLNPLRAERLTPDQLAWIRRESRRAGCHTLASYEMREAGYGRPVPVAPEDEAAQLQREYIAAVNKLASLHARIDDSTTLHAVAS